jgi:hypothetical protein
VADYDRPAPLPALHFRVELRALPDDRPVEIRLRHALKTMLRRDRLRCVRLEGIALADQQLGGDDDDDDRDDERHDG